MEQNDATGRSSIKLPKMKIGSPAWTRTTNLLVNSQVLCQLSYRGLAFR